MRIFTSMPCIGVIGALIMFPLSFGILAAQRDLLVGKDVEHIADMLAAVSLVVVGGVVLVHHLLVMAGIVWFGYWPKVHEAG